MNRRSVYESSPVQQMMARNPNGWNNINSLRTSSQTSFPFLPLNSPNIFFPQLAPTSSSSSSSSSNSSSPLPMPSWQDHNQDYTHESLSQLLLSGLVGEEEKAGVMSQFQVKKMENWEEQIMLTQPPNASALDIKPEVDSTNSYLHGHGHEDHQYQALTKPTVWSQIMAANSASSPNNSCVTTATTFNTNMLDFTNKNNADIKHPPPDRSSECNSTATGGALKKARIQPSSTQATFKVRKEKLGERITALHQLVSPFGKTDTASVLLEAIGYIRFLQSQIEALSLPYLGSGSGNMRQQQSVHGERNCMFPEHPGQLLNDNCLKRKGASEQDSHEEAKGLRSRGLCLVPVSCTLPVGSDNGADFWAPALGGGGGSFQ